MIIPTSDVLRRLTSAIGHCRFELIVAFDILIQFRYFILTNSGTTHSRGPLRIRNERNI